MKSWRGKKVTVMGLGLHGGGVGTARWLARQGARVTVTDIKSKEELAPSVKKLKGLPINFVLGIHRPEDFTKTDLIVQNPGVPQSSKYLALARENKVPVDTEMGIFFQLCPAPIIGITGTKGKSTVATLLHRILLKVDKNAVLAGNIRVSALESLAKIKPTTPVVLELSSWQLEGVSIHKLSPYVAVVLNVFPDHLNRYRDFADYMDAKRNISRFQRHNDHLVVNADEKNSSSFAEQSAAKIWQFGNDLKDKTGVTVKDGTIVYNSAEGVREVMSLDTVRIVGEHNVSNVLAATAAALAIGVDIKVIKSATGEFLGIPGRLEVVGEINDVKYVNDTTATAPDAVRAAINSFAEPIILIAGGTDKKLPYSDLAEEISKSNIKKIVFLPGSATDILKKELSSIAYPDKKILSVSTMAEAVERAGKEANPGDVVLLSPGAASFGLWSHEFERGDEFVQEIKKQTNDSPSAST